MDDGYSEEESRRRTANWLSTGEFLETREILQPAANYLSDTGQRVAVVVHQKANLGISEVRLVSRVPRRGPER